MLTLPNRLPCSILRGVTIFKISLWVGCHRLNSYFAGKVILKHTSSTKKDKLATQQIHSSHLLNIACFKHFSRLIHAWYPVSWTRGNSGYPFYLQSDIIVAHYLFHCRHVRISCVSVISRRFSYIISSKP
jgi:hypothetical protein